MKFSIVTPAYNMEDWIATTIEMVITQAGNFDIEYIVMDDGSKDRSADIAEQYKRELESGVRSISCNSITMHVVRQENTGMYEAINRGFTRSTGDVFAWINADDIYEPGALETMRLIFESDSKIQWAKGKTATIEEDGSRTREGKCRVYRQDWLRLGIYGQESYFVEQDSVFWRASLWKQAGPMPKTYRSAADYWLWVHFAQHAPLVSVDAKISCFRKRRGQISKGVAKYKAEQWDTRPRRSLTAWIVRCFFSPAAHLPRSWEPFFLALYPFLFRGPRPYLAIENGAVVERQMPSYMLV